MPFTPTITLDLVINPIVLCISVLAGIVIGYIFGIARLRKSESKLRKLESELLSSHEETLESQRAYAELQSRLQNQTSPVIPMKINGSPKENPKEKASK